MARQTLPLLTRSLRPWMALGCLLTAAGCGEADNGSTLSPLELDAGHEDSAILAPKPDAAADSPSDASTELPADTGAEQPGDAIGEPAPKDGEVASEGGPDGYVEDGPPVPTSGTFHALTYNVAGLPQGISSSDPAKNTPLISPKLNAFDLVLAQEDFAYHAQLVAQATHPWKTSHKSGAINLGDGVSVLSMIELGPDTHVPWSACNGLIDAANDCLTPKGFVTTTMILAPGAEVDLYDLHADAGSSSGDMNARDKQMDQLLAYMAAHSAGKALIVAGDTNMDEADEAQLTKLMTGAGLVDSCRELGCPEPYRIDRILYRSSAAVSLTVSNWRVDMTFVDSQNQQLSDHEPVAVDFTWDVPGS